MSNIYDGWLHSLSQDGTYPFLLEKKGNVRLISVRKPTSVYYYVWSGDETVYDGPSNTDGYLAFRNEVNKRSIDG